MPNGTVAILPRHEIARAPAESRRSAGAFAVEAGLVAALLLAGVFFCVAALLVLVLAAPLVAAGALWLLWRVDEDAAGRQARRMRARLRRRARALGLVVLARVERR